MTCTTEEEAFEYIAALRTMEQKRMLPEFYFFWKGPLSQWAHSGFKAGSLWFPTAEHWMMYSKAQLFGDQEAAAKIYTSPTPNEAKEWGRTVRGYDERIWMLRRYDIVRTGNLLKFSQNTDSMMALSLTGNTVLVEASPHDVIWGIGRPAQDPHACNPVLWNGSNLLGFVLMSVREALMLNMRRPP